MLRLEAKQKMLFTVIYLIFQFLKLITESRNLNVWCYISSVKICQMTLFLKNGQKSIKKGLLYPLNKDHKGNLNLKNTRKLFI